MVERNSMSTATLDPELVRYLDPHTAKQYRVIALSRSERILRLGTDNDELLHNLTHSRTWLSDWLGMSVELEPTTKDDIDFALEELYADSDSWIPDLTSPVTDVLKRVIFIEADPDEAKRLKDKLEQYSESECDFRVEAVGTVEAACLMIQRANGNRRDLILLSENTFDFFGSKARLEKIASETPESQTQVIGAESVSKKPELVYTYFRRAA